MPKPPPDDAFLCERCGYILDGLEVEGECPECGKAILESLPSNRVGSRYQRSMSLGAVLPTAIAPFVSPSKSFALCVIDKKRTEWFSPLMMYIAAAIIALSHVGWAWFRFGLDEGPPLDVMLGVLLRLAGAFSISVVGMALLVRIERFGIGFVGRRRGWRITRDVAYVVTAHAAGGWVLAGFMLALGLPVGDWLSVWIVRKMGGWAIWDFAFIMPWAVPAAGFVAGMIIFELMVWKGIHICRYANPPDVGPEHDPTHESERTETAPTT